MNRLIVLPGCAFWKVNFHSVCESYTYTYKNNKEPTTRINLRAKGCGLTHVNTKASVEEVLAKLSE